MARAIDMNDVAIAALDAVNEYLMQTARAHQCVGFDCKVCALNGARYSEALDAVRSRLESLAR